MMLSMLTSVLQDLCQRSGISLGGSRERSSPIIDYGRLWLHFDWGTRCNCDGRGLPLAAQRVPVRLFLASLYWRWETTVGGNGSAALSSNTTGTDVPPMGRGSKS